MNDLNTKTISELATIIQRDWSSKGKGVNFAAVPYLNAMRSIESVNDQYGFERGDMIVRYFLGNAGSWRGDVAKAVKKELNARL